MTNNSEAIRLLKTIRILTLNEPEIVNWNAVRVQIDEIFREIAEAAYEKGAAASIKVAGQRARREFAKELLAVGMYFGEITDEKDVIRFRRLRNRLSEEAGLSEQAGE
jgi:hypothetical protein